MGLTKILLLCAGGAAGTLARYLLSIGVAGAVPGAAAFPYGTLAVNLSGAFVMGMLWALSSQLMIPVEVKLLVFVGFLGAFTTFSTYVLESYNLFAAGQMKEAVLNVIYNNAGSIILLFAGILSTRAVLALLKGGN